MSDIPTPDAAIEVIASLVVVAWLTVIPLAGATVSRAITVERIFDWLRDFIEIRWPRTLVHYLVTCPVCMSYWTTATCSIAGWITIGAPTSVRGMACLGILTLAAIRIANILAVIHGPED